MTRRTSFIVRAAFGLLIGLLGTNV